MSKLTDAHIEELDREGFIIVPDFVSGDKLKSLQAAQRRVLPTWEQIKADPPQDQAGHSLLKCFPHEEMELYQAAMDEESLAFARKWLKTKDLHARVGCLIARYPGHTGGGSGFDDSGLHIDNGNNSLLPQSEDLREFGQIGFWIHLEDVEEDQAPLRLVPKRHGRDMTKCVPLVCKGGTLCVFTNFTWHSASAYTRKDGQRFTWGYAFGRADPPLFRLLEQGIRPWLERPKMGRTRLRRRGPKPSSGGMLQDNSLIQRQNFPSIQLRCPNT